MSDTAILQHYISVAELLGEMFAPDLEVIVHDLRKPNASIIAIVNGHITSRSVGDGTSDLGHKRLRGELPERIVNYHNETAQGHALRSSTLTIRNSRKAIIGCFALNYDISQFEDIQRLMQRLSKRDHVPYISEREEFHLSNPLAHVKEVIARTLHQRGWEHIKLSRKQKAEVITTLDAAGCFQIQTAVPFVASELQCSRTTIYKYIQK